MSWEGFAPNNPGALRPEGPDPQPQLTVAPLPLPRQEALAAPRSPTCSSRRLNWSLQAALGGQAEHGRVWRKKGEWACKLSSGH